MNWREMIQEPVFVGAILLVAFMIMGTHYAVRYHNLFLPKNKKREAKVMGRYVTGTFSMLLPYTLVCWAFGWWAQCGVAWLFAIIAGFFTGLFYGFDKTQDAEREVQAEKLRADHNEADLVENDLIPPEMPHGA